jgi:ion channel-forming bestrophin family protein
VLSIVEKPGWFRAALQLKGTTLPIVLPRIFFFGGFGLLISLMHAFQPSINFQALGDLTTNVACNLVLGLLLVFRTNTAYEKFWEGRKAWGGLVVNIRNLAREIQVNITATESTVQAEKKAVLKLLAAFAVATKLRLRHQKPTDELSSLIPAHRLPSLEQASNPPLEIILWIGHYLQQNYQQNHIDSSQRWAMSNLLNELVAGLTSCERILTTPIPLAYTIYLKRLILLYCFVLPFGLVEKLDWWTGFVVAIISFILLGVEEIGSEIEDPFGTDPNDLPLDQLCHAILTDLESTIAFVPDHSLNINVPVASP